MVALIVRRKRIILCKTHRVCRAAEKQMGNVEKPEACTAGPKVAAEKGVVESETRRLVLQGLKPDVDLIGLIGTTEVVP